MNLKSFFKLPTKPCNYCGKDVKLPFQYHKECKRINIEGQRKIISLTMDCFVNSEGIDALEFKIKEISSNSYVDSYDRLKLISKGLDDGVNIILKSKDISTEEENLVNDFLSKFKGIRVHLDLLGTMTKIAQTKLLKQIKNGELPNIKLDPNHPLSLRLMKSERLIYLFPREVNYYRVMNKGLQYEYGGELSVTTKHIYFISDKDSFRIKFDTILNIIPRNRGIEIQKSSSSEKPKVFENLDGEFLKEIINIATKQY